MTEETTLFVKVEIEGLARKGKRMVGNVAVAPESLLSWIRSEDLEAVGIGRRTCRQFLDARGTVFERWTGATLVTVGGRTTIDDVVFAEPGDRVRLGRRSLSGLNLRVDSRSHRLVDAGAVTAAGAA